MISVDMRTFYRCLLSIFDSDKLSNELLMKVTAGSDKGDDYEEILKKDKFFTSTLCRLASATMKTQVVTSLGHGVVVVGQQNVRNFVLGHCINRLFSPHADIEFMDMASVQSNVTYALKAEEHARRCRNEYGGLAFASGYVFDIFAKWITKEESGFADTLKSLLDSVWRQSLRTATIAWALATHERIFISHRKIIFSAGLLHDIGKLGLALFEPREYSKCLERMKLDQEMNVTDHGYEAVIEREYFDMTHTEVGSAIVFQTKYLRDIELETDFHHDSILLRTRNPDAFLGAEIINMADRIAWLIERHPAFTGEDLQDILKGRSSYFPLDAREVMRITTELRARGLLSG